MNLQLKSIILVFVAILTGSACTKGVPDITQARLLDGFELDQAAATVSSKSSPVFTVTGKCSSKFENVELSLDSGASWKQISSLTTSYAVNCRVDSTFQANFDFTNAPLETSRWSGSGVYEALYFRGVSEFGYSALERLTLETKKPGSGFQLVVGGSYRTSISGGYKLVDRVHSGQSLNEVSPQGYKLKAAVW